MCLKRCGASLAAIFLTACASNFDINVFEPDEHYQIEDQGAEAGNCPRGCPLPTLSTRDLYLPYFKGTLANSDPKSKLEAYYGILDGRCVLVTSTKKSGDVDVLMVHARAGEMLRLTVSAAAGAKTEPLMIVYDSAGNILVESRPIGKEKRKTLKTNIVVPSERGIYVGIEENGNYNLRSDEKCLNFVGEASKDYGYIFKVEHMESGEREPFEVDLGMLDDSVQKQKSFSAPGEVHYYRMKIPKTKGSLRVSLQASKFDNELRPTAYLITRKNNTEPYGWARLPLGQSNFSVREHGLEFEDHYYEVWLAVIDYHSRYGYQYDIQFVVN